MALEVTTLVSQRRPITRNTVPLKADDITKASELLTRALLHDPLWQFIEPDARWRVYVLPRLYAHIVRYCHRYGRVDTNSEANALACWLTPAHCYPTLWRTVKSGKYTGSARMRVGAVRRLMAYDLVAQRLRRQIVPENHFYMWAMGVTADNRKKGLARALMQTVLSRTDADHVPAYVETCNPDVLPFLQRFGFKEYGRALVRDKLVVYALRRN